MKSAFCLLLLCTLVPAYQAIKCFCDEPYCAVGSGPQEECPNSLGLEYYDKHPDQLEYIKKRLPDYITDFETKFLDEPSSDPLTNETKMALLTGLQNATVNDTINFLQSYHEIASIALKLKAEGKNPVEEIKTTITSMLVHAFQVLNNQSTVEAFEKAYEPKPVNYQFCMKTVNGMGNSTRSCGIMSVLKVGLATMYGCHDNPLFQMGTNNYPKYCRCDKDQCNAGVVKQFSSYLLIVLFLVKMCVY